MTRIFDIVFSFFGILLLSPLILILFIIGFLDTGSPLFIQERLGKDKRTFQMIKFRTMKLNTPSVATHLINTNSIKPYGIFLRKYKLDELPQLWNVLIGDMSLVGPRPNLLNQTELIAERTKRGIYAIRPGITGLAQINKILMETPHLLTEIDAQMIAQFNLIYYFKCIILTLIGRGF